MLPEDSINGPKTLRQLTNQLVNSGYILKEKSNKLITVHSLSKTDCFAGARLAVIEIPNPELKEKFQAINSEIKSNRFYMIMNLETFSNVRTSFKYLKIHNILSIYIHKFSG